MDHTFTFSVSGMLFICGAILTISNVVKVIGDAYAKSQEPNTQQNKRIEILEHKMSKVEEHLGDDKDEIDRIEEGNKVTQQSLLALMSHAIDGNSIDKLNKARNDLENYLVNK